MDKYACGVCSNPYDPATGDPRHGVPAGTKFEDVAEEWTCPVCGAEKRYFEKIN